MGKNLFPASSNFCWLLAFLGLCLLTLFLCSSSYCLLFCLKSHSATFLCRHYAAQITLPSQEYQPNRVCRRFAIYGNIHMFQGLRTWTSLGSSLFNLPQLVIITLHIIHMDRSPLRLIWYLYSLIPTYQMAAFHDCLATNLTVLELGQIALHIARDKLFSQL